MMIFKGTVSYKSIQKTENEYEINNYVTMSEAFI